ncbi:MAG TPA: hypothetical protein VEK07_12600, partial [Polyangiaceae bacterium]|nr:hypothetical protein [Polyangiaceae bacterium]
AIWGFKDAVDLPDAATSENDATDLADSTGAFDSAIADGGTPASDASSTGDTAADVLEVDSTPPVVCACAPPLPGFGWNGPFELFELQGMSPLGDGVPDAAAPANLPSCGQNGASWAQALDLHGVPEAAPADCACACGSPSTVCSAPVANYFDDPMCKNPCALDAATIDAGCTALAAPQPGCMDVHVELSTTLEDAGTCAVDASIVVPPVSWQGTARLCSPSPVFSMPPAAGACEAGICVPPIESPFESAYCIIYADIVACPDAGYAARHAYDAGLPYYTSVIDTRTCTPCGCEAPTGVSCALDAGTSTDSDQGMCVAPTAYSGCTAAGPAQIFATATAAQQGGSCTTTPDGGQAVGAVLPTAPYTICCTQ